MTFKSANYIVRKIIVQRNSMWGKKKILVSMCIGTYKRQAMYRTRVVIRIYGGKKGEGYSEKLLLTTLYNVHSFLCLWRAAKDGIFKISSMS